MERDKQETKDRCLRSIAIFSRAIFYIVQEDRKPIKPYQLRNCPMLHAGKSVVYSKEGLKSSRVWRRPVLWIKATAPVLWAPGSRKSERFRTELEDILNPSLPHPKCQGQLLVNAPIPRMCWLIVSTAGSSLIPRPVWLVYNGESFETNEITKAFLSL